MKKRNDTDRRYLEWLWEILIAPRILLLVREDRRKLPDRRLAGIEVEGLEMTAIRP